jgi:hypothetical protein
VPALLALLAADRETTVPLRGLWNVRAGEGGRSVTRFWNLFLLPFFGKQEADRAEEAFQEVRHALIEQGIGYDAALVSLELAALYARQGRTAEMKELAGEMLPIFQAADVHREALAALAVFQQAAVREETATLELVEEVAAFLDRARHDPGLRFGGE